MKHLKHFKLILIIYNLFLITFCCIKKSSEFSSANFNKNKNTHNNDDMMTMISTEKIYPSFDQEQDNIQYGGFYQYNDNNWSSTESSPFVINFVESQQSTSSLSPPTIPSPPLELNLQTKIDSSSSDCEGGKKFPENNGTNEDLSSTSPPLIISLSTVSMTNSTPIKEKSDHNETLMKVDVQKAKNDSDNDDSYGHNDKNNEHLYKIGSIFTWSALLIIQIEMIAIFLIVYSIYKTIKKFSSVNQPTTNVENRRRLSLPVSTSFVNNSPGPRIEPNSSVGNSPTRCCPFRLATHSSSPGEEIEMAVVRQNSNENSSDISVQSPHVTFNLNPNIHYPSCPLAEQMPGASTCRTGWIQSSENPSLYSLWVRPPTPKHNPNERIVQI